MSFDKRVMEGTLCMNLTRMNQA